MKSLPDPLNISKWYRKIECKSGINEPAVMTIKRKVDSEKEKNPDVVNGREYG